MCSPENHKEDFQTEIKHMNVKLSSLIIIKVSKYIVIYTYFIVLCETFHKAFVCLQAKEWFDEYSGI